MDKQKIETQLAERLQKKDIKFLARFLLQVGAGTILPRKGDTPQESYIVWELAEALSDPRDHEWETEIGRLVMAENKEGLRKLAGDVFSQLPTCPECLSSYRIRPRKGKWWCAITKDGRGCGAEWSF